MAVAVRHHGWWSKLINFETVVYLQNELKSINKKIHRDASVLFSE
jgi:hypothetical protein